MASFFRTVLKWLAALFVAAGLFLFLGFLMLAGLSRSLQPEPAEVASESILVIDLRLNLVDSPRSVDPVSQAMSALSGEPRRDVPLRDALAAVERAAFDDRVTGILLKGRFASLGYGNSLAALGEFRQKLAAFQSRGKTVWAYVDNDGLADIYVKSVADQLWMNPYSLLEFKGLGTEVIYWGEAFDRFGIGVQVEKAGRYKTAAESFVESSMSAENREQMSALLEGIWEDVREDIATSRGLSAEALDRVASEKGLMLAEEVEAAGLIDELVGIDELIEKLAAAGAREPDEETFQQIGFLSYLNLASRGASVPRNGDGAEVAVVYAEGIIVDGEGEVEQVGGERVARHLRAVRKDARVKAVVLRVNSPGGSATASEKILREVELTNQTKPVVVSMGGYAASGGYWIATLAETVFAEPTTITGSIGVYSLLPNVSELMNNLSLNVERVETNELTTMFSLLRPKTEEELARMERFVAVTYEHFLERVSRGRGLSPEAVEAVAQGRVWSGESAVDVGLVDRIGGLEDAIAHAASLAGLEEGFAVTDHPHTQRWEEVMAEFFGGEASLPKLDLRASLLSGDPKMKALEEEIRWLRQLNDPRHLYAYSPLRIRW